MQTIECKNKEYVDPNLGIALAFYLLKDNKEAKKFLDEAIKIKPYLSKGMEGITELKKQAIFILICK